MTVGEWALLIGLLLNVVATLYAVYQIRIIEKATNSLTDRLVQSTADASHAEGMKDEKDNVARAAAKVK